MPLMTRLAKVLSTLSELINRIGQLQIIRKMIAYELRTCSKHQARQLSSALATLNNSLLADYSAQCRTLNMSTTMVATETIPTVFKEESLLLYELSSFLEFNGQSDCINKVYTETSLLPHLRLILMLTLVSQMPKLVFTKDVNSLLSSTSTIKLGETLDGLPFVMGMVTVLKQFHVDLANSFFEICSQFVNASIHASSLR